MKKFLKQVIKQTPLYYPLHYWKVKRRLKAEFTEWERNGKPMPPPHIYKQRGTSRIRKEI